MRNRDHNVFYCTGEASILIPIVLGLAPVLVGLLLIIFSGRLSAGASALLARVNVGQTSGLTTGLRVASIVFGVFLMFAGVNLYLFTFVLGC